MNQNQIPKVKAIIKTLLITKGPQTAREMSEFIDFNDFYLGKQSISAQQISSLIKQDYTGILKDVQHNNNKPRQYYLPGGSINVR